MFKVSHLSKTFSSRGKTIKALDDVSFTLASKGMVFITGKSGSGKSTLLNILGTLETASEGEVYFNNLNLSKLNKVESAVFRNEVIGFMFQDFCLLEDFTVYQNISLSLDIKCRQNIDEIDTILKKLDLYDFKNTKVIKLSVGQKERVAIARAVIKNPKVILCDEPTGNLDSFNSKIILDYLKELSKDILVLIITHNLIEAYKYANRILELEEGRVIKDLIYPYSKNEAIKLDDKLYLNDLKSASTSTKLAINHELDAKNLKDIKHISSLFIETSKETEESYKVEETRLNKTKLKSKKRFLWTHLLFKKEYFRNFLYTLISAVLIITFSMTFSLTSRSDNDLKLSEINNYDLPLYNVIKTSETVPFHDSLILVNKIIDEEKEKIDAPYFPLSNFSVAHKEIQHRIKKFQYKKALSNFESFYALNSYGTLYSLTRSDLNKIFNEPSLYIEEVAPYKKEGVYLTDYQVDAYRYFSDKEFVPKGKIPYPRSSVYSNGYCNGIIHTNYKNKYKSILDKLNKKTMSLSELPIDEFKEFIDFASRYLAISYSFEEDFNKCIKNPEFNNYQGVMKSEVISLDESFSFNLELDMDYLTYYQNDIEEGNILTMPLRWLNEGRDEPKTYNEWMNFLEGKKFILRLYESDLDIYHDLKVEVTPNHFQGAYVNKGLLKSIQDIFLTDYSLYFLNKEDSIKAIETLNDPRFKFLTLNDEAFTYINKTLNSFNDFFSFFMIILFIASIGTLILLGTHNVKALKYKIGILKGLGISNFDLYSFYAINIIFILGVFLIVLFPLIFLFNNLGNKVLFNSFKNVVNANFLKSIEIFSFSFNTLIVAISLMVISLTLSVFISLIKVNRVKPIDILKRI